MLLTYPDLVDLLFRGVITNADVSQINAASIDVTLAPKLLIERKPYNNQAVTVDLSTKESPAFTPVVLGQDCDQFALQPRQFLLASTTEQFDLPNDIACEFKLKSSHARAGLNHALAGWADPGFHDAALTLELTNITQHHALILKPGMPIGQLVFWRGAEVPPDASYSARGRYNGTTTVSPSRAN